MKMDPIKFLHLPEIEPYFQKDRWGVIKRVWPIYKPGDDLAELIKKAVEEDDKAKKFWDE